MLTATQGQTRSAPLNIGGTSLLNLDPVCLANHLLVEEARLEAQQAVDVHEKVGAASDLEIGRKLLQDIQEELNNLKPSHL